MGLRCKRCGSEEQVKNGLMRAKQRYRCKACGLNFTDTPARGKPLAMKATAVLLYVSGLSMNRTGQAAGRLDAHHPGLARAVRRRLRAEARAGRPGGGDRARRDVALSKKKSEPLWIWKAWDRASGQLVDWECGGRDKATCERLIARLSAGAPGSTAPTITPSTTCSCRSGSSTPARTRPTASSATTPGSGTGWPASAAAPSWSRRPSAWWTSASRCSPASPETAGSANSYLCWPKTLALWACDPQSKHRIRVRPLRDRQAYTHPPLVGQGQWRDP